jgi:hypothetical protein
MKFKLFILLILVGFSFFVIAQVTSIPPGFISAMEYNPVYTCIEQFELGGPDIFNRGWNYIIYPSINSTTNASYNATYGVYDFCDGNGNLVEGVCGSWVNNAYNTSAYTNSIFAATFNCSASNNGTANFGCQNGACVVISTPGNNTGNQTNTTLLADLIVNVSINNIINLSNNTWSQYLINYSVTYQNIGNFAAPNNVGSFSQSGPFGGGGGAGPNVPALAPGQSVTQPNPQTIQGPNIYGTWYAVANVDSTNIVVESNENNNNDTITFSI